MLKGDLMMVDADHQPLWLPHMMVDNRRSSIMVIAAGQTNKNGCVFVIQMSMAVAFSICWCHHLLDSLSYSIHHYSQLILKRAPHSHEIASPEKAPTIVLTLVQGKEV